MHINGGTDCVKVVYPDLNENEYAVDEGCDGTGDTLEQFNVIYTGWSIGTWHSYFICLNAGPGECLSASADANNEIVGGAQSGYYYWWLET